VGLSGFLAPVVSAAAMEAGSSIKVIASRVFRMTAF
jgi:hypothetical protein